MLLLPLLLLPHATFALQAPATDQAPSVRRLYEVRSSMAVLTGEQRELVLLPVSVSFESTDPNAIVPPVGLDTSGTVSFLRALDPAQWEYEGRELNFTEPNHLDVLAPPALQDVVTRSVAFLEEVCSRPTTIVVDLVAFGPNPGVANLPALLPAAEVARWTSLGTGHESYEITLRPGERCRQRAERSVSLVSQHDVEVAERAVGFTIHPDQVAVGTALEFAVAPARTGTWIAFTLRNGRFVDTEGVRESASTGTINNDQGSLTIDGPRTRSDARLVNHSLSINAFLPEGKALAYVTAAGLESRVVFVRQVTALAPIVVNLPEELKRVTSRNAATFVRTDAVNLPVARVYAPTRPGSLCSLQQPWPRRHAAALVTSAIETEYFADAFGTLRTFDGEFEAIEMGAFMALVGSTREPIDKVIAKFDSARPEPRSATVTMTLRRGTREAAALVRAVVPIRFGAASTIVLGRESLIDWAASVSIAQGAAGTYAEVGQLFDGLVVSVTPRATVGGDVTLELDAHGRWSRAQPREFASGLENAPRVQLPDADLLDVLRTVVFAKSESGSRKVTLGNAGTSSEALTLEVELVDLR